LAEINEGIWALEPVDIAQAAIKSVAILRAGESGFLALLSSATSREVNVIANWEPVAA
jgi:hypothetical protein